MTKYNRAGTMDTTDRRTWSDYADTYRSDWESRYGTARSWDEYGPAYRYGWEAGTDDRYRGREFSDVENDLQGTFSDRYTQYRGEHQGHDVSAHQTVGGKVEHVWENFKDTVREGFDRARGAS
jgi:hypothetical protein